MKKILALSLTVVLLFSMLAVFSGCAAAPTENLLEEAKTLIARSAVFNEIYYGEGIPYLLLEGPAIGNYYYADPNYLEKNGFQTIEELKKVTAEVFSADYCEELYLIGFSGFGSANGFVNARYSSNQAENLRDEDEKLLVFNNIEPTVPGKTTYDLSTAHITETGTDYAFVALTATVAYPATPEKEAYTETYDIEIKFIYERVTGCNGYGIGWRIDTPTY